MSDGRPYILVLLFLSVTTFAAMSADAQEGRRRDRAERPSHIRYGEMLYAEAVTLPSDSAGLSRVDVFLRIAYDYMVFIKSGNNHPDSTYAAGIEVSVNIENTAGVVVASLHEIADVYAGAYDVTNTRDNFALGSRTFYLTAGIYKAKLLFSDKNSTLSRRMTLPIKAVDFTSSEIEIGGLIPLVALPAAGSTSLEIAGFSRSLRYGKRTYIVIPASFTGEARWEFTLQQMILEEVDEKPEPGEIVFSGELQPVRVTGAYTSPRSSTRKKNFTLVRNENAAGYMHFFELPFQTLDVGLYRITVKVETETDEDVTEQLTRIFWKDRPRSLRSIDEAIYYTRYILTDDVYEDMQDGSDEEKKQKFKEFWKEHDPTPDTETNEHMTEYFKRVDEAKVKFRTLYVRDGADTDRGKVYILFGPPEDSRRKLGTNETMEEIWYYPSLKKTFRFTDKHRDRNLILVQ